MSIRRVSVSEAPIVIRALVLNKLIIICEINYIVADLSYLVVDDSFGICFQMCRNYSRRIDKLGGSVARFVPRLYLFLAH